MGVPGELWVAYTRIFFVELAYWIVSIGMVFVNDYVLSNNLLTDDLTVFVTIFQVLFSLSILLTMNYLTKNYLYPSFDRQQYDEMNLVDQDEISSSDDEISEETRPVRDELDQCDDTGNRRHICCSSATTSDSNNPSKDLERKDDQLKVTINDSSRKKKLGNHKSGRKTRPGDQKDQDGLVQLLIVNIPGRLSLETCKTVLPLSILYTSMLLLNNFCLKYVGVAFYFVSRSLTTVFNVIFTYFIINEPVSRGALVCCGFIVLGFLLGIDQESVFGSFSLLGVMFGVSSSLFTSLFSIYTKKTLLKVDKNIWTLVFYNNINAILLCTPLLIVHGDLESLISEKVLSTKFWLFLSISGVMAFFISIVTNASIKYTSPLTHNISGTAKACLQTVIAVIYNHDHKSPLWWLSNLTILIASAFYSRIKQKEMESRVSPNCSTIVQARSGGRPKMDSERESSQRGSLIGSEVNEAQGKGRERRHSSSSAGDFSETSEMIKTFGENDGDLGPSSIVLFERNLN